MGCWKDDARFWWPLNWTLKSSHEAVREQAHMQSGVCVNYHGAQRGELRGQHEREFRKVLQKALEQLSADDRCFLAMCYLGGLNHDEIAVALSVPKRLVIERVERALRALQNRISEMSAGPLKVALNHVRLQAALSACLPIPPGLKQRVMAYVFGASTRSGGDQPNASRDAPYSGSDTDSEMG